MPPFVSHLFASILCIFYYIPILYIFHMHCFLHLLTLVYVYTYKHLLLVNKLQKFINFRQKFNGNYDYIIKYAIVV